MLILTKRHFSTKKCFMFSGFEQDFQLGNFWNSWRYLEAHMRGLGTGIPCARDAKTPITIPKNADSDETMFCNKEILYAFSIRPSFQFWNFRNSRRPLGAHVRGLGAGTPSALGAKTPSWVTQTERTRFPWEKIDPFKIRIWKKKNECSMTQWEKSEKKVRKKVRTC